MNIHVHVHQVGYILHSYMYMYVSANLFGKPLVAICL